MDIAQDIYGILTKRRYNRDEPFLKEQIILRISKFVKLKKPIKLVGFWGIGQKDHPNWADLASCKFLDELRSEIKAIYSPGIEFVFIFAKGHGVHNGIKQIMIESYVKDIVAIFEKYDFKWVDLNELWKKYDISLEKIENLTTKKQEGWWGKVKQASLIEHNAKKRNRRLESKEAAQMYYIMRDLEKEMLEAEFSDAIFHAFSDSRLRSVLPNMPTLYFYARKGWSDTPWFVTKEK